MLAPNAFKGTFTAVEVARAWRDAVADRTDLEVDLRPMGDGGDGFADLVRFHRTGAMSVSVLAADPLGRSRPVVWVWEPESGVAYLESASAIGLKRLESGERDPLAATTEGLGRLVRAAAALGPERIVIGLGGSATVDGGLGMARALGYRFVACDGSEIARPDRLADLGRIVPPQEPRLGPVDVTALVDVDHPLLGPHGAAAAFGPQKGADEDAMERLEEGLARLAERWVVDLDASPDLTGSEGAGAAGGLGAACRVFLVAEMTRGAEWCAELADLARGLEHADAVVTGEGAWDPASSRGKATGWVVDRARRLDLPVVVACARVEGELPRGVERISGETIGRGNETLDLEGIVTLGRRAIERLVAERGG